MRAVSPTQCALTSPPSIYRLNRHRGWYIPGIPFNGRINGQFVVRHELQLGRGRTSNGVRREPRGRSLEIHIVAGLVGVLRHWDRGDTLVVVIHHIVHGIRWPWRGVVNSEARMWLIHRDGTKEEQK